MSHPLPYQLTRHPVGSKAEIWAISWPLMLGFCSSGLMMFADRLYLAHYSLQAMNAMAYAMIFCYLFLIFPFALCEITEVFVGRFHGEGRYSHVASPTWQIVWFILALWPLFGLISQLASGLLFAKMPLEATYFRTFLFFGPCILITLALTGFFVGIGKTRVITYSIIVANVANLLLAPLLIFYADLGIMGAALATGLAQGFQALLLLGLFLQKKMRTSYSTHNLSFSWPLFKEMMRIGLPTGISRFLETLAHSAFFAIMAFAGPLELTIATFVQSFFLLVTFINDGLSKGVTSIIANLIGAKSFTDIPQVLRSSYKVQGIIFCFVTAFVFLGAHTIFYQVLKPEEKILFENAYFVFSLNLSLLMMCLFFLFDGLWWIHVGHLTALGDTKFIMYVNCLMQWGVYILPTYLLVTYANLGALGGWFALALNGLILFLLFRARSERALHKELLV